MKNIWIVAPFTGVEENNYRNRFPYIAKMLSDRGYNVTLITSQFSHFNKVHILQENLKYPFRVELLYEKGYRKNVSLSRIVSHSVFSKKLKKWMLNSLIKPDIIYVAYPTMTAANEVVKYAKLNDIPVILDIQDTWPESISAAIDTEKWYIKLLLMPLINKANSIYKSVDAIIGVSKTYIERAKIPNTNSKFFEYVYIGSDLGEYDSKELNDLSLLKNEGEIWITYIGTLSYSYDIETAIIAVGELGGAYNIKLNILGDGPNISRLKELAKKNETLNYSVFFKGYLPYSEMVSFLSNSDIALNAIKGSSKATITNKFGDYLFAGLPILNCCESIEIKNLINEYNLGINYKSGEVDSLKFAITKLIDNEDIRKKQSLNSKKLAIKFFNREISYRVILDRVEYFLK
ncbi:MAG: glycosyltransferase family 4 protein [Solibacillus sp.]